MGIFDNAVPGGNISKPLIIALGALLVGKMLSGGSSQPAQAPDNPQTADNGNAAAGGGLLGGLGGLLNSLTNAGHGETANSWLQPGENKPIAPGDLGSALGQETISEIAQQTGMSEQDLLAQLSKILPGVVDQLTPNGQVPSTQQIASLLKSSS